MTTALPQDPFSPAPRPAGALWTTPPGVLVRRWADSETGVAYDARHARTHLLSATACDVLEHCRSAPVSLTTLAADTQADFELMLATVTALEVAGLLLREPQWPAAVVA